MKQAVEDRGRQHFIAGQDHWPIPDAFVGGDQDAAALVAVADEPEELAGLLPGGLEADLVDDQQRGREVLLADTQSRGRQVGVAPERGEQFLEPVEHDAEAVLDGLHAEDRREMDLADRLADPRSGACGSP